jgi:drug/metabolite transporter (DMT)-like permease
VLGLVCSALAFILYFALIAEVGPGRATVITYVNPTVALALGVAILGESVSAGAITGLLLILAGSWLATDGRLPPGLGAVTGRLLGSTNRAAPAQARDAAAEAAGAP